MNRIIGAYSGVRKGPLLICVGGMHGNEPAGVHALTLIFKMLEVEPITNPDFEYAGRIIGLRGNLKALEKGKRYIDFDLNRMWTPENIDRIFNTPEVKLLSEELELKELLQLIYHEIEAYQPEKLVLLDLHTTTAYGGIFSIATDDPESVRIAVELHAPVVKGMLEGIQGTTLHYFNDNNFAVRTVPVSFESGQHEEPLSINRAIAGVINCMRTIGSVKEEHVENRHDTLLIEFSRSLPKVAKLVYHHAIYPGDGFKMLPDYKNFQPVRKGELLAHDNEGPIYSPHSGLILMPHYQKQGDDGFFILKNINNL